MGAHRRTAVKMALPLYGTLFLAFLALSLLFSLLRPAPSLAQGGDVWFNVDITGFKEGDVDKPGYFPLVKDTPITVYKDGRAHAEGHNSSDESGQHYESSYVFNGRYDKGSRTLSGNLSTSTDVTAVGGGVVNYGDTATLQLRFIDNRNLNGTFTYTTDYSGTGFELPPPLTVTGQADRDVGQETTEEVPKVEEESEGYLEEDGSDEYLFDEDELDEYYYDEEEFEDYLNEEVENYYDEGEGEGSKIPGPGSWWQWLTGTVVAGTIAAGLGLLGALLGSAPPAPPLMGVFDPSPPDIAGGPARLPSSVEIGLPPPETGLIDQALMNTFEDIGTIPGYLFNKAKWVYSGVTDMDNLKTALEEVEEWSDPVRDALRDKLQEVVDGTNQFTDSTRNITDDPLKPFNLLGEEQLKLGDALAKYIKENPREILEGFLRGEWWENAMDWRRPLLERLGWSTIATLNTIGLIEGASGLKNWVFGGGEKAAVGEALKGKVVPKLKSPKSAWKKAVSTPEGRTAADAIWKEQVAAGKGKVKAWKGAMREGGDAEARTKALLDIRRDPAALKNLNDEGSRALITKYNEGINGLQDSALEKGRKTLAGELGEVRIFKATNRSTGVTAKNDLDFTYQVKRDGKWVDVPSPKAQEHFDQAFHKGVGSPSDITPEQLSKDLRCKAVAQHDAEALGLERADFNAAKSGKTAPNPQTVGQGIEYKANENLVEADRLTGAGDIAGANTQRSLAQREIFKAYNNQIEGRIKYLKERGGNMALVDKKIAGVEDAVRDMKAMQKSNASPADISEMLGKRGWTEESLGKRIGEIYEELNR